MLGEERKLETHFESFPICFVLLYFFIKDLANRIQLGLDISKENADYMYLAWYNEHTTVKGKLAFNFLYFINKTSKYANTQSSRNENEQLILLVREERG